MVSTVAAQDTLRIQSLRSVDLCSDKKRWLIAVSVGTVRFSDSLESFDITIGFNSKHLRPTDVLKEGTLSAQMSNGPTMNTVTPGEMRIFGFNVARSVAGDVPLVAVAGDFIGSCSDHGDLTLPFPPDFNGEFKKRYSINIVDSVETFTKKRLSSVSGCRFNEDSLVIKDELAGKSTLSVLGKGADKIVNGRIELLFLGGHEGMSIGTVHEVNCTLDSMIKTTTGALVYFHANNQDTALPLLVVESRRESESVTGRYKIETSVYNVDDCSCILPGLRDTIDVAIEKPTVGIGTSYDDGSCTIEVKDDFVIGKCLHHAMEKFEVYNRLGERILASTTNENGWMTVSTMGLSHGLYFAKLKCDGGWKQKTIVK